MTKKMIEVVLNDAAKSYLSDSTLEDALHQIKRWIQEYGGKAKFEIGEECSSYSYSNDRYAYVRIVGVREETDEQYQKRLAEEAEQQMRQDARERKQFEALKKKFGN